MVFFSKFLATHKLVSVKLELEMTLPLRLPKSAIFDVTLK